jgi:hypothetical protein
MTHQHFEFLCALAVCGELSPSEEVELATHVSRCAGCSKRMAQFTHLTGQLALADLPRSCSNPAPRGMRQRFLARAASEGIPVFPPIKSRPAPRAFASALLTAALLFVATLRGDGGFAGSFPSGSHESNPQEQALTPPISDAISRPPESAAVASYPRKSPEPRRFAAAKAGRLPKPKSQLGFDIEFTKAALHSPLPDNPEPWDAPRHPNTDATLTLAFMRLPPTGSRDFAQAASTHNLNLAQLWPDNSPHPAFLWNTKIPALDPPSVRRQLDLDAYLPNTQPVLKLRAPRFNFWPNASN